MKIKSLVWQRFNKATSWLALPAVLVIFSCRNDSSLSRQIAYYVAISFLIFCGTAGAILAILKRFGVIEFTYSDEDTQTTSFQISKSLAKRERHIWGSLFSAKYYESFDKFKKSSGDDPEKNQK